MLYKTHVENYGDSLNVVKDTITYGRKGYLRCSRRRYLKLTMASRDSSSSTPLIVSKPTPSQVSIYGDELQDEEIVEQGEPQPPPLEAIGQSRQLDGEVPPPPNDDRPRTL